MNQLVKDGQLHIKDGVVQMGASGDPCCCRYYKVYDCCEASGSPVFYPSDAAVYYVTEAEYNAAIAGCAPGFVPLGLLDGDYYIVAGLTEDKPDLPHFPGTLTCDVCSGGTQPGSTTQLSTPDSANCFLNRCRAPIEDMYVYIPVRMSTARFEWNDPTCTQLETLDDDCDWDTYIRIPATEAAHPFFNHSTGEQCGSDPGWVRGMVGWKADGDVLKTIQISPLMICGFREDCDHELPLCEDVDLDSFTWFEIGDTPENICEFLGLT